ncbi:MAG: membrane protein insertase YidC [Deltaproteobacteria bacterium]|nr:membrane protein insertase YidC [Deltaproteobacteria bacterium]
MSTELRMLLAIVLSFLVFFVYQAMFGTDTKVHKIEPANKERVTDRGRATTDKPIKFLDERAAVENRDDLLGDNDPDRIITVSTRLYETQISERMGCFKTFKLKKYKETPAPDAPMKELIQLPPREGCTPTVSFLKKGAHGDNYPKTFRAIVDNDTLDATKTGQELSFSWTSSEGITVTKTYFFIPDSYEIDLQVKVRNLSDTYLEENLTISLRNHLKETENSRYAFSGPAILIDGTLKEIDADDIADEGAYTGTITWAAIEDQYFMSAIIPDKATKSSLRLDLSPDKLLRTTYVDPAPPVAPKTERTYSYKLYFGPKNLDILGQVDSELTKIIDFGFFDIIAKPLLYSMNFIYRFIPNYGIAIIFITILVKILFWPLSNKSYKSMGQMKRLQPKMAELRAKYKHDKKMMNQELMNLYKVYKVNPLGGCLPMILQIPVFFAFYKMLYQAIELRHAPFFLWINDLAAPDRLFHFDFQVPLMAPPYGVPVLTIIMGASMFFQQKMSPPPGDPTQAKMMMFMPIFFTFIFINFPSGLVLYWLVNNVFSMAQQYYITKKTA